MKKEKERFDCVIGRTENDEPVVLIAPQYSRFLIGDIVRTDDQVFRVAFADSMHEEDDELMTALYVMTGKKPLRIKTKVEEVVMDWGDANGRI